MQLESDPDIDWVARLSGSSRTEAEAVIEEARREKRLFAYLARQHAREGRDSYVEIDAPLELHALVRLLGPKHVVEVGVSSGVSSAYLLNALARNGGGTLHSIDRPSHERARSNRGRRTKFSWSLPPGRSTGWAVPPRLLSKWDLRLGGMTDVLPILSKQIPSIDLLVFDVPHDCSALSRELQRMDALFPPGAVVMIDHGPGGGMCPAVKNCARRWGSEASMREGLGLSATHRPPA